MGEAEYFFADGFDDILYAVGMSPAKAARAASLIWAGCHLTVVTDSLDMAGCLSHAAADAGVTLPVLIELDVDGHRSGVDPQGAELLPLAAFLDRAPALDPCGVMTHAGES